MGKNETLKCIPASMTETHNAPACFKHMLNHLSSGFFLFFKIIASLGPTDAAIELTNSSMTLCSWIKASSIRGLNLILPCQIAITSHVIFFPSLHFPNDVCMFTESVVIHTHRNQTINGRIHYERKHGVNTDCLWPTCTGDLQQESWSVG